MNKKNLKVHYFEYLKNHLKFGFVFQFLLFDIN